MIAERMENFLKLMQENRSGFRRLINLRRFEPPGNSSWSGVFRFIKGEGLCAGPCWTYCPLPIPQQFRSGAKKAIRQILSKGHVSFVEVSKLFVRSRLRSDFTHWR